jgi:hypothetical protein
VDRGVLRLGHANKAIWTRGSQPSQNLEGVNSPDLGALMLDEFKKFAMRGNVSISLLA